MHRRGFTLIELLVVIGIIALLAALVIIGMGALRLSANRATTLNALRQMQQGYTTYSTDYDGKLMPGYIHPDDMAPGGEFEDMRVRIMGELPLDMDNPDDREDAASYVWRLHEYLGNGWEPFVADYRSSEIESRLSIEVEGNQIYGPGSRDVTDLGVSYTPSIGMNSIMVGGDSFHGGAAIASLAPWIDRQNALGCDRLSQAKNPSKLIVFGSSAAMSGDWAVEGGDHVYGDVEIRAPFLSRNPPANSDDPDAWANPQWSVTEGGRIRADASADFTAGGGVPVGRWSKDLDALMVDDADGFAIQTGNLVPIANLDGSTESLDPIRMSRDMSRWHWNYTRIISSN